MTIPNQYITQITVDVAKGIDNAMVATKQSFRAVQKVLIAQERLHNLKQEFISVIDAGDEAQLGLRADFSARAIQLLEELKDLRSVLVGNTIGLGAITWANNSAFFDLGSQLQVLNTFVNTFDWSDSRLVWRCAQYDVLSDYTDEVDWTDTSIVEVLASNGLIQPYVGLIDWNEPAMAAIAETYSVDTP